MAIRSYLISLGATHLLMFDGNGNDEPGVGSVDPTNATLLAAFDADRVCEGVSVGLTSASTFPNFTDSEQTRIDNRNDINGGNGGGNDSSSFNYVTNQRTVCIWYKSLDPIDTPTCVYEQGGGTNNFAFCVGIGRAITWQAADAGQPFLIAQSQFQATQGRAYFLVGTWKHNTVTGGGNEVELFINGVSQQTANLGGTATFPGHSGDITVGNTQDNLQSYNGTQQAYVSREKRINMLGMFNNVSLTAAQAREIFERSVIPEVTIAADTVENQQAALDALIGNTYTGVNCAIRVVQATDQTNYRLFVDGIDFVQDPTLRDISIQFVGAGVLTLENCNGSNTSEISQPAEVDLDGTTILPGGGSITIDPRTVYRVNGTTVTSVPLGVYQKVVFEVGGAFDLTGSTITELENVSGAALDITIASAIGSVLDTGAGSVTNVIDSLLDFNDLDQWTLYPTAVDRDANTNAIATGTDADNYTFSFATAGTFFLRLQFQNDIIFQDVVPAAAGITTVELSTASLLAVINGKVDQIFEDTDQTLPARIAAVLGNVV